MSKTFTNTRIGILGGGQLGRMLIQSGIDVNLDFAILDPDAHAPCHNLTSHFSKGELTDFDTVYRFGKECDLITIEIENVNVEALKKLQDTGKDVYPQPDIIAMIQDKAAQKQFYKDHGIPTAPFELVSSSEDVLTWANWVPMVNKLAREGYDGRGVQVIRSADQLGSAFNAPGIVEKFIDFEKEISVIVARSPSGEVKSFPVVELVFHKEQNLVEYLFSPAEISDEASKSARRIAENLIEILEMTGILAVEMFLTPDGDVLVNEIAPRPHNSGHQSIEGNVTSQYEQHLRAILDLPLGNTDIRIPTALVNLLGEDKYTGEARYEGIEEVLAMKGAHVHLYGKKITRPFRKMGHVTICEENFSKLKLKARFVKETLKVKA